jgi:hypothetical protein
MWIFLEVHYLSILDIDEKVPSELKLPAEFARLWKTMHSLSFAVVPIKVKGEVRAVFGVDRKTSNKGVTLEDKEILDLFSEMVGKTF